MNFWDTHVHLWHNDYYNQVNSLLARAKEAGVVKCVVPGIDLASCKQSIALSHKYSEIIPAIGLHPMNPDERLEPFRELAALPEVKAIGEIGIDRRAGDFETQEKRFRFFIELAIQEKKPILVHILHAWEPVLKIMAEYPALSKNAVWHCFNADLPAAQAAKEMGLYLSFTAIIARKKMESTHEVIKMWPLEQMMLETDGPWLSWPGESGPNEPATVLRIAEFIASIKNYPVEKVAQATSATAQRFFNLE